MGTKNVQPHTRPWLVVNYDSYKTVASTYIYSGFSLAQWILVVCHWQHLNARQGFSEPHRNNTEKFCYVGSQIFHAHQSEICTREEAYWVHFSDFIPG